jgi:hypothetical protein
MLMSKSCPYKFHSPGPFDESDDLQMIKYFSANLKIAVERSSVSN